MPFADLLNLKAGDIGVVDGIASSLGGSKRLADMGFIRGAKLEMIRPGSPCIVRIDDMCVGLGVGHQANIRLIPS